MIRTEVGQRLLTKLPSRLHLLALLELFHGALSFGAPSVRLLDLP
jgi:hypothetical protein